MHSPLAQILLSPNPAPAYSPDKADPWPKLRDFVSFVIGLLVIVLVRFIYVLATGCF